MTQLGSAVTLICSFRAFACCLLASSLACGRSHSEPAPRDGSDNPAIVGVIVRDAEHPACAGTLIAPSLVVTAAHCIDEMPVNEHEPSLDVFTETDARSAKRIPIQDAISHPAFVAERLINDVAVLRLSQDLAVTPIPIWPADATQTLVGQTVRFVGFSAREVDGRLIHRKTEGTAKIVDGGAKLTMEPAPALPCVNDSGGPVLLQANGREYLVGVISSGDRHCSRFARATTLNAAQAKFIGGIAPRM